MVADQKPKPSKVDPRLIRQTRREYNFWFWLIAPESARGGRKRWLNWLLVAHGLIGFAFASIFRGNLPECARSVILPLAGVLVGLTFAWSATAIGIINSKEFRRIMVNSRTGVRGTANYYQLAILVALSSTVLWAIAGLGPYETPSWVALRTARAASATFLFAFTSFAITECWSAINLTRLTLLSYNLVQGVEDRDEALAKNE